MTVDDPAFATVVELSRALAAGTLSPREIVDANLARIDRFNDRTKAYVTVTAEAARETARAVEPGAGALRGIPYAAKDMFATKGVRTTAGSRVLADWVPDDDAAAVERLAAAGAPLLGKANLHEFAYGATGANPLFGTAPNPWDAERIAGGSSSGSAVAVACGLAAFALGTDTGGSVRMPAASCGVVGFKPTYGRISCRGSIPFAWSLDHVGLFTRCVADAAIVLDALAGYDPGDPASADVAPASTAPAVDDGVEGLRVGVPRGFFFEHCDPEIADAVHAAAAGLERLGATRTDVDFPAMDGMRTVSLVVQLAEGVSYHGPWLRERGELYGADLRAGLALGQFLLAEHYLRCKRMIELYRRRTAALFDAVDLIVTPTVPLVAPAIGAAAADTGRGPEAVGDALTRYTTFFNMSGNPALSLPVGMHSSGLPMGLQIVGRTFDETTVLKAARALERALAFAPGPPPLCAA